MRGVATSITCRTCGELITAHWQVFEHRTCAPGHGPTWQRIQAEMTEMGRRYEQALVAKRLRGTGITVVHAEGGA